MESKKKINPAEPVKVTPQNLLIVNGNASITNSAPQQDHFDRIFYTNLKSQMMMLQNDVRKILTMLQDMKEHNEKATSEVPKVEITPNDKKIINEFGENSSRVLGIVKMIEEKHKQQNASKSDESMDVDLYDMESFLSGSEADE
jgi:hypothetical protein